LDDAIKSYKEAISIDPDYAKAYYNLAGTLQDMNEFEDSIENYKKSLEIEPNFAEAHNNLGNVCRELGELEEAVTSYQRAIVINKNYVEAIFSLGVVLQSLDNSDAIECFKKTIKIKPDFAEAHNNLGIVLNNNGQVDEAVKSYQKAIEINSNYLEAHNNLGNAYRNLGQLEEASLSYQKAISIKQDYPTIHNNLGNVLKDLGRLDEAIESYKRAIAINPDFAETYSNLGGALSLLDKLNESAKSYEKAIDLDPSDIDSLNNLGNVLKDLGQFERAAESYEKAIDIYPNYAEAYNNLGNNFKELGHFEKAINSYRKALSIEPNYYNAFYNLGICYHEYGQSGNAIDAYQSALDINPDYADALNNLGNVFVELGKVDKAVSCYENALTADTSLTSAHRNLSAIKLYTQSDKQLNQMELLFKSENLSQFDRINLCFALAKAYDDLGTIDKLFEVLNQGNSLRKDELDYQISEDKDKHLIYKEIFTSNTNIFEKSLSFDKLKVRPIFIVGMPRSGTTLVEQILSSHHDVYGSGESVVLIKTISEIVDEYLKNNKNLSEKIRIFIRQKYLDSLNSVSDSRTVVTDKMPINFEYIGFILTAFPEAKIIHMNRDPMATCWSIYKNYFTGVGMGFSYNMEDLANYYNLYLDLMDFWKNLFPNKIYDLCYEDLTANQEQETRDLLKCCELDWDDNCLNFHENKAAVKTTSALQVRQKIYQGSSEVWKEYESYLQPLIKGLSYYKR